MSKMKFVAFPLQIFLCRIPLYRPVVLKLSWAVAPF